MQEKLDKVLDTTTQLQVNMAAVQEHLRNMNGKLVTHEQRFSQVYSDWKESKNTLVCEIQRVEQKTDENKGNIDKAQGVSLGIGLLATLIGIAGGAKALGLW